MSELALKLITEAKERRLTRLNLDNSKLTEIPKEIFKLTWLEELHLCSNQVSDVSPLEMFKKLKQLDLRYNQVSDVSSLGELDNLTRLYLSSNHVRNISPLVKLNKLVRLDLYNNQISTIEPLASIRNLIQLDLSNNQISDVTPLGVIGKLAQLYLGNNQISDISPLATLSELTELYLSSNQISDVSPIKVLKKLVRLNLHNNQISDVSPLTALENLIEFYLSSNQISDIGPLINHIRRGLNVSLEEYGNRIRLNSNPVEIPPKQVIEQGNKAIIAYFDSLAEQGVGKLNEAKLIIVGEPDAGKTTLVETLINPKYELSPDTQSTLGIEVREGWQFPHPRSGQSNETFTVNIWDFGGQQIQYMTHQFFLTPSALYVLLSANDRKEPTNFPYWFKIIHLLGEEKGQYSPVLVVLNEKDKQFINKFNFDLTFYQKRYPELQITVCEVDLSKRDAQYEVLRGKIQKQLSQLPHVSNDRPARWNDIREDLRELAKTKDYIDYKQYAEICESHNVTNEASQMVLSGYLHRLGSLLHFVNDPSLRNLIILKPQWAVDAVYSVLVDNTVARNDGYFTQEKLDEIWQGYSVSERDNLLNLMKQENFEICYELDCKENTYIAPQLLSDKQPFYDWDENDCLKFRFQYKFMPEGIITRLIVRLNALIAKGENCDLIWNKGVVLEKDGCRAQVKEEESDDGLKVVDIAVTGNLNKRKFLLHTIREEIHAIHSKWFKNIEAEQMVPCSCTYCVDPEKQDSNFFKLAVLERGRDKGKQTIECDKDFLDVPIMDLLEGVFDRKEIQCRSQDHHFREADMSDKPGSTNVTYNIGGNVGALGGVGDDHKNRGKVITKVDSSQAITELQEAVVALSQQIESSNVQIGEKIPALGELTEIRLLLSGLDTATSEDKGRLLTLLDQAKDESLGALKVAKDIKDAEETVSWFYSTAMTVSQYLMGMG